MTWDQFQDILPIVTLLGGFILGIVSELIRDKRTAERDQRRWFAEFQRSSLLTLQASINDLENALERLVLPQLERYQRTGEWSSTTDIPPQLDIAHNKARRELASVAVRISDGQLRELVSQYQDATLTAISGSAKETSRNAVKRVAEAMQRRAEIFERVNERLGELLRLTY
jgi:hypothetical protein